MITIAATDIFYTQNRPSKFSFSLLFLGLFLYFLFPAFLCVDTDVRIGFLAHTQNTHRLNITIS